MGMCVEGKLTRNWENDRRMPVIPNWLRFIRLQPRASMFDIFWRRKMEEMLFFFPVWIFKRKSKIVSKKFNWRLSALKTNLYIIHGYKNSDRAIYWLQEWKSPRSSIGQRVASPLARASDSCLLCKLVVHREASRVSRSRPYRSLDPFRGIDCSRVFLPVTRKERNSRRYPRHGMCFSSAFQLAWLGSRKLENVVWKRGNNWKWVRESNSSPSNKKDNAITRQLFDLQLFHEYSSYLE